MAAGSLAKAGSVTPTGHPARRRMGVCNGPGGSLRLGERWGLILAVRPSGAVPL
jgi:hypothetical protein